MHEYAADLSFGSLFGEGTEEPGRIPRQSNDKSSAKDRVRKKLQEGFTVRRDIRSASALGCRRWTVSDADESLDVGDYIRGKFDAVFFGGTRQEICSGTHIFCDRPRSDARRENVNPSERTV